MGLGFGQHLPTTCGSACGGGWCSSGSYVDARSTRHSARNSGSARRHAFCAIALYTIGASTSRRWPCAPHRAQPWHAASGRAARRRLFRQASAVWARARRQCCRCLQQAPAHQPTLQSTF